MLSLTDLILETFRLNGELLAAGDRLVADLHLTSARWQVLGAVGMAAAAMPVAHIARNMGLTRQAVQRTVNDLAAQGLVRLASNPHHQRARLVLLTPRGEAVLAAAMERQGPWVGRLSAGLPAPDIDRACRLLRALRDRLRSQNDLKAEDTEDVEEFT